MKTFIVGVAMAVLGTGCIDQTYFGESTQANITTFTIQGAMNTKIEPLINWSDVGTIDVTVPMSFNLDSLKVTEVVCSQLAHFDSDPMLLTNFSKPVELFVTAENSSARKKWIITVSQQKVEPVQLPFSNFTQWAPAYTPEGVLMEIKGQPAYWPGNGKDNSPWQSTVQGNYFGQSVGITEFSSYPMPQPQTVGAVKSDYARLMTINAGPGAKLQGTGMAAGGIFTGSFVFEPSFVLGAEKQPRKMMNTGTPFYSKPKGVRFDVRYKAGDKMMDGKLNPISYPRQDSCDIQFALQNRLANPNQWVRVATAALRTPKIGHFNDEVSGFERYEMEFVYGTPTAAQIAAKPYQQLGGAQGELFSYTFVKTGTSWKVSDLPIAEVYAPDPDQTDVDHIVVMASSSAYGDLFKAAIGSTLDIKNIELIY